MSEESVYRRSDNLPWWEPAIVAYWWETYVEPSGSDYNTSTGSADVKGVPPPDGGTPQTRDFWDKVGDAIDNVAKPKTESEAISDTVKWVAIALAAVGAVYIVHKVL